MDVKKADRTHRFSVVAKGIKTHSAPGLSAATPPIESLKYALVRAACGRTLNIMNAGDTRAYLHADAARDMSH